MAINIPEEKKQIIYEAALDEFSQNGYDNGSTNVIVKKAGISKGSLFNYFGSKAGLYIFVVDEAMSTLDEKMLGNLKGLSSDMFERIAQLTDIKVKTSLRYPRESRMLVQCISVDDDEIKKYVGKKTAYYYGVVGKLFTEGIDYSRFKEGVDPAKVYEMLTYISEGLQKKYLMKYKASFDNMVDDLDAVSKEVADYVNLIKDSVYK